MSAGNPFWAILRPDLEALISFPTQDLRVEVVNRLEMHRNGLKTHFGGLWAPPEVKNSPKMGKNPKNHHWHGILGAFIRIAEHEKRPNAPILARNMSEYNPNTL